jgi:hypothetical protein
MCKSLKTLFVAAIAGIIVSQSAIAGGPPTKGGNPGNGHSSHGSSGNSQHVVQQPIKPIAKPTSGHNPAPIKSHTQHQPTSTLQHGQVNKSYHLQHAKTFVGGYCYHGRSHNHWTYSCYSQRYGCNCHWCPSTCCYYYWCEPACCYYPVTYVYTPPVCLTATVSTSIAAVQSPTTLQVRPAGVPPIE